MPSRTWRPAKETTLALQAFEDFWDLGPDRNMPALLESYRQRREAGDTARVLRVARNTMATWSATFDWYQRARERQRDLDQARVDEQRDLWAQRQFNHRGQMFELSRRVIAKGEEMIKFPTIIQKNVKRRQTIVAQYAGEVIEVETEVTELHPAKWTFLDAVRLIAEGDKMARLAAEMETERVDVHQIIEGLAQAEDMSDDERMEIEEFLVRVDSGKSGLKLLEGGR